MSWQAGLIFLGCFGALAGVAACLYEARERRKLTKLLRAPRRQTIRQHYQEHAHAVGHLRGVK